MRRIGLLGGSFNPAHAGHLHITCEAIKRLKLQEVWWVISPQNPLKSSAELAEYALRRASAARMIAQHPRIRMCEVEAEHGLRYSIDTIRHLQARHRGVQFVWLMGADNLAQFHRWRNWREILARLPIAILDRAPYAFAALRGKAALRYQSARAVSPRLLRRSGPLPRWAYLAIPRHPLSATHLRKTLGAAAFLRHNTP
jgi:nicotinate-nucleotide adenylyltransferase